MKRAVVAAVVLASSGLALPAHAATPAGPTLLLDRGGSLVRTAADTSDPQGLGTAGYGTELTTSSDGSRFAYLTSTIDPDRMKTYTSVVVRDISGRLVKVLAQRTSNYGPTGYVGNTDTRAALATDGNTVAWVEVDDRGHPSDTWVQSLTDGALPQLVNGQGLDVPQLLTSTRLLALDADQHLISTGVQDFSHGAQTPQVGPRLVAGVDNEVVEFAVSPDRSTIALVEPANADETQRELLVAPLQTDPEHRYRIGTPTTIDGSFQGGLITFSADGQHLLYVGGTSEEDPYSVPVTGGPATDLHPGDQVEVIRPGAATDTVAPGPVTARPAVLGGTKALVQWALPSDADLSGVSVTRSAPGTPTETRYVSTPGTGLHDTGLVLGKTYTYSLTAYDRSGNASAPITETLTATSAVATYAHPTSTLSTRLPFRVSFPVNAGTTYNASVQTNGGPWVRWLTNASGPSHVWSDVHVGQVYAFRVQAFDGKGNATAITTLATTVAPFDQNAMTFTGPTASVGGRGYWLGTARVLRPGARASYPYKDFGTQVIGSTCPTCGVLTFLVDGHVWETVNTRSSSRHDRRVLISAFVGEQHTVTLEVSRGDVILDGFTDGY